MSKQLNVNLAFTADTSKAKFQLQDLQKQLSQVINMPSSSFTDGITKDVQEATKAAAELKIHLENATNIKTGSLDFTKLNQSIKNSGTSLSEYAKKLQSIGPEGQKAFVMLAQSVATAEVPIRRSNALLSELWVTMKNTARWQLTSSALHNFMGAVQSAVRYTEDLNESLNNIRIVTGSSVEQMANFAKEANQAAKSLNTSTTDYTNAALIYYQQGLTDQHVQERTDITVKMANVSRQSAEEVSDQMTAIWNNFYDGSQSLEHYADAMTKLGADTASSSDEIAQGLEKFAAIGNTIGLSFDNAAAALATVTATTRQSADVVGTAFKTIFARIQGLSLGETLDDGTNLNKYSEALLKVGISIKDQSGQLKDMDTLLAEMGAKWKTLDKDQQVALAQTVAGVRQYNQLVALMDNYDFYEKNLQSAQNADGVLQKQADIYAESWEAASERVGVALEGLYDSLINDEAFIDLLNIIEKIITGVEKMIDSMGGFGGVLSALGVVFTNVFRKQISESITDASYSLMSWTESGRQKIQQEKIEQVSLMLENKNIGDTEKAVLQAQLESYQMLTNSAKDLTDFEKQTLQILLDQQKARGNLAIQKEQELNTAKNQEKELRTDLKYAIGAYGNGKEDKKKIKAFEDYEKKIDEFREAQKKFNKASEGAEKDNAFKELKIAKDNLDAVKNNTYFKNYKKDLEQYEKAVLKTVKIEEELTDAIDEATNRKKLSNQEEKESSDTIQENSHRKKENVNASKEAGQSENDLANSINKTNKAIKEQINGFDESKQKKKELTSSQIAQNFVASANAAMSAVSAIQAMSSVIDTLNSDAEPMEKFNSILMSLPIAGSMALNSLKSLNKITAAGGKSLGAMAASSKGLGTALSALGIGATTTAGQILALGGYVAIAAVAIGGLVLLLDKLIVTQKEANEAIEKSKEAYVEAKSEVEALSDELKTVQDRISELQAKGPLTLTEQAELNRLKAMEVSLKNQVAAQEKLAKIAAEKQAKDIASNWNMAYRGLQAGSNTTKKSNIQTQKDYGENMLSNPMFWLDTLGTASAIASGNTMVDYTKEYKDVEKTSEDYQKWLEENKETYLKAEENYQILMQAYADGLVKLTDAQIADFQEEIKGGRMALVEGNEQEYLKQYGSAALDFITDLSKLDEVDGDYSQLVGKENLASLGLSATDFDKYMASMIEKANQDLGLATSDLEELTTEELKILFNNIDDLNPGDLEHWNGSLKDFINGIIEGEELIIKETSATYSEIQKIIKGLKTGDTITAEEMDKLGKDAYSQYFRLMADGTYQLTADAKEFYDLVEDNTISDFYQKIQDTFTRNDLIKDFQENKKYNFNQLSSTSQNEYVVPGVGSTYNWTKMQEQLDFLKAVGHNKTTVDYWQNMADAKEITEDQAKGIAEAVALYENKWEALDQLVKENTELAGQYAEQILSTAENLSELDELMIKVGEAMGSTIPYNAYADSLIILASQYANCTNELNIFREALNSGNKEDVQKAEDTLRLAILTGELSKTYNIETDVLKAQVETYKELYSEMQLTEEEYVRLAVQNQRMNSGLETLYDNWKDYSEILGVTEKGVSDANKGTAEYAQTIAKLQDIVIDLTGANLDLALSTEFVEENIKLIEKAANGSAKALQQLGTKVAQFQVQSLTSTKGNLQDAFGATKRVLGKPKPDFSDNDGMLALEVPTNRIQEKTEEELQAEFDSAKEIVVAGMQSIQDAIDNKSLNVGDVIEPGEIDNLNFDQWIQSINDLAEASAMTEEELLSMFETMGMSVDPKYIHVKTVELTESVPQYTSTFEEDADGKWTMTTSQTGYTTMTAEKQIATLDQEAKIKYSGSGKSQTPKKTTGSKSSTKKKSDEIERYHTINKEMDSINRKIDRAAGKKNSAFGSDKLSFIQKEIDALDELIEKHKEYKEEIKANLLVDEAALEGYGFIDKNQDKILDNWEEVMNEQLRIFNEAASAYDKGKISEKAFSDAEKKYEEFKSLVEQYEETQELWEEALTREEELERERISKELEKITTEVDFEIEIKQRDLDRLERVVDRLSRDANNMIEIIDTLGQQVSVYGDQSQWYLDGIQRIRQTAANEGRELTDDEQRKIWEYQDALEEINTSLEDIVETVENSLLEEFERWNSEIDENIDRFNTYSSSIEHYINIIKLSGRQTSDSMLLTQLTAQKTSIAMEKLNASYDKYQANLEAQKNVKAKLDMALSSGSEEDKEYWQKQYDEITKAVEQSHDEVLASWEDALQAASDQFDFTIEQTIEKLKNSISQFGLDGLSDRYEKAKTINEQYLSELEKEYELNKLIRQVESSIDNTDNLNAKRELINLLDKINQKTAEGVKLSKYDLDYMQAEYELELAKLALEEARNAKTSVRLQRDDAGNYSYVYTADQENIAQAEQNYEDKLYAIQELSKNHIDEMSDLIIQNEQELMEALAAVDKTKFETEEAYQAELNRITEYYYERDTYLRTELNKAVENMGMVYGDTILGQLENCSTWEKAQENLKVNTDSAVATMTQAWSSWKTNTEVAMQQVGTTSQNLSATIQTDAQKIASATTSLAGTINTQTEQMKSYIESLIQKIWEWRDTYLSAIREMQSANTLGVSYDANTDYSALMSGTEYGSDLYNIYKNYRDQKLNDSNYTGNIGEATTARINKYLELVSIGELKPLKEETGKDYYTQLTKDEWIKLVGFKTGGYTGQWGPEGKLAYLHEKELVLNADDTKNILNAVDIVRTISKHIEQQAQSAMLGFASRATSHSGISESQTIQVEQDVTIRAEFPNATDQNEIKEAILGLVNYTAQYVARR